MTQHGYCLCGAIRYEFDEVGVIWQGHCHCESCRRACGAPLVSWFGVDKTRWRWTGETPSSYRSSDWAERWFCPKCGTPMGYASDKLPDEMHGLASTLSNPDWFTPQAHYFHSKSLPWLHIDDDLPRYVDGGKTLDSFR